MRREGRENEVFENQDLSPIPNPRSNPAWVKEKKSSEYQNSSLVEINAERGGFEPPLRFRKHAFQACAFSHSATSPFLLDGEISNNYALIEFTS